MKVTQKQLLVMWDVLKNSASFMGSFAGYKREFLEELVQEIFDQQSDEVIEVE